MNYVRFTGMFSSNAKNSIMPINWSGAPTKNKSKTYATAKMAIQPRIRFMLNLLSSHNWGFKCFFYRPSFAKPLAESVMSHIHFSSPLSYCHCFFFICEKMINATIVLLILSTRPNAIFFVIPGIIILAFDSIIYRRLTHILKKISKIFEPSITYFYAAATIILICPIIGIVTSLFHAHKNAINSFIAKSVRILKGSHMGCSGTRRLIAKTSAGLCKTGYKMSHLNQFFCPAFTNTVHVANIFSFSRSFRNYGKSSKFLAYWIYDAMCWHFLSLDQTKNDVNDIICYI